MPAPGRDQGSYADRVRDGRASCRPKAAACRGSPAVALPPTRIRASAASRVSALRTPADKSAGQAWLASTTDAGFSARSKREKNLPPKKASRFAGSRSHWRMSYGGAMPDSATGRSDSASITCVGDFGQARTAIFPYRIKDRKDVGCGLISASHLHCPSTRSRFGGVRQTTERYAGRFLGLQCGSSPLRDQASLFLGERGEEMQHERIGVAPQFGYDRRHALRHQSGHKRHIARKRVDRGPLRLYTQARALLSLRRNSKICDDLPHWPTGIPPLPFGRSNIRAMSLLF